jgi:hypothetical protein
MPKITRHSGLTVEGVTSVHARGLLPDVAPAPALADEKEEPWVGSSSETSPVRPPKSDEPKKLGPPKRARTTGGRSKSAGASGTAPTATTNGPVTDA